MCLHAKDSWGRAARPQAGETRKDPVSEPWGCEDTRLLTFRPELRHDASPVFSISSSSRSVTAAFGDWHNSLHCGKGLQAPRGFWALPGEPPLPDTHPPSRSFLKCMLCFAEMLDSYTVQGEPKYWVPERTCPCLSLPQFKSPEAGDHQVLTAFVSVVVVVDFVVFCFSKSGTRKWPIFDPLSRQIDSLKSLFFKCC